MRPAVALVNWPGIVAASNGGKLAVKIGSDRLPVGVGPLRVEGGQDRQRLVDHAAVLEPCQVAAIEVIAAADHDLDAICLRATRGLIRRRRARTWSRRAPGIARARPLRRSAA